MRWQVKEIHSLPEGHTVHFGVVHEIKNKWNAYCGCFGFNSVHSTVVKEVTCKLCLKKLKREPTKEIRKFNELRR